MFDVIKELIKRLFSDRDERFVFVIVYSIFLFVIIGIGIYVTCMGAFGVYPPYFSQTFIRMGQPSRLFFIGFGIGLIILAIILGGIGVAIYIVQNNIYIPGVSFPGLRNIIKRGLFRPKRDVAVEKATNQARLESVVNRIKFLHDAGDCPFVLAGSTYLDVKLDSVPTTQLEENEWGNMGPLQFHLGGSAYWFGYYLWKLHQCKSHLFSARSIIDDPLASWYQRLIDEDTNQWLIGHFEESKNETIGVTVILVQAGNAFTTMFTSPGVLKQFCFSSVQDDLYKTLSSGGVLYISGYFKTSFCKDIKRFLRGIVNRDKVLICIDHGRLIGGHDPGDAVVKLQEVIQLDLIDIYICTFKELWSLYHYNTNQPMPTPQSKRELQRCLKEIATTNVLPPITIIRDSNMPDGTPAYVHLSGGADVDWKAFNIPTPIGSHKTIGAHNSFNAEFLYQLITSFTYKNKKDLDLIMKNSIVSALDAWNKWNKQD